MFQKNEFDSRIDNEVDSTQGTLKGNEESFLDREIMELMSKAKTQQEEILRLRDQIDQAYNRELRLLSEKYVLERRFSDLRMALNEKQNDAITATLKDLARRKGDLEENSKLVHDLKVAEDEKYIFTSSLLAFLAEYGVRPHVITASAIANSVKILSQQLQLKIRVIDPSGSANNFQQNTDRSHGVMASSKNQLHQALQVPNISEYYSHDSYHQNKRLESTSNAPKLDHSHNTLGLSVGNSSSGAGIRHQSSDDNLWEFSTTYRGVENHGNPGLESRSGVALREVNTNDSHINNRPSLPEEQASSDGEVMLPGIEGLQIIGEAKPGNTLLACGYPTNGTSLCMFQWIRHLENGTREYIEGCTNPEYVVTVDDVDKLIAVECVPMDDGGTQGELVRIFANNQMKITCDPDVQNEIEFHISTGRAEFGVLMLIESSEEWEPTTLALRRSSFLIKCMGAVVIEEKYSPELSIKIPTGLSLQFVVTCSNGTSYPFSTNNDWRLRDVLVLTMRNFRNKALYDRKKGKI